MNGMQTQVGAQQAVAVAGDFASGNPRFAVLAGQGGLVSGSQGVTIGRFAWWSASRVDNDGAPSIVNNFGSGPVTGFVHRDQQGLITTYLADASMRIPPGFEMGLMDGGDFFVVNDGSSQALIGQKAYANFADGKATFAATASPTSGASGAASSIAAGSGSAQGSISGNVLTITGAVSGSFNPGGTISGSGVASGTQIVSQLSGTAGGDGTYALSIGEQVVAITTITESHGILTVGGTVAGTFGVGDIISGTDVVAGTTITALGSGTGGAGTYIVNNNTVVGSTAISVAALNVETKWVAMSTALPGELVKISSQPLG